ncbi:MAG: preprotein translocase subunit SecG [bacterium]|nr:preprotein translocase subunit SecG [bacterium]
MTALTAGLPYFQIGVAVLLIATILLQQTGAGLSEVLGGAGTDVGFHTRRGAEKTLFYLTIVFASFFFLSALTAVFLHQ